MELTRDILESLYNRFNHKRFVTPDPLQFLYDYPDVRDREIVALIAASFAFGRVELIVKTLQDIYKVCGKSPRSFVMEATPKHIKKAFPNFTYRFVKTKDLVILLCGMRHVLKKYTSLENCFLAGYSPSDTTVLPALKHFVDEIYNDSSVNTYLLPRPERGSACKRLHLFLRWMVRKDRVDPGGWKKISPSALLMPIDTHIYRICHSANFTRKTQPTGIAAQEITAAFRILNPRDPVKYDFSLTRLGMHSVAGRENVYSQNTENRVY